MQNLRPRCQPRCRSYLGIIRIIKQRDIDIGASGDGSIKRQLIAIKRFQMNMQTAKAYAPD